MVKNMRENTPTISYSPDKYSILLLKKQYKEVLSSYYQWSKLSSYRKIAYLFLNIRKTIYRYKYQ